jgi:nucleotide-binding universal stress UspA family protein
MARHRRLRSVRSMFQRILVGYDSPKRGDEATALADALRDPRTGRLLLASAYDEGRGDETAGMLEDARERLRTPDRAQVRAIASDTPGRTLKALAETERADLVVVGSGSRSALGHPLPGTAAERLACDPPCPVAVAPRGYTGGDIRRIGIVYDGSPSADGALRAAESLALDLRAPLTVYLVADPPVPSGSAVETLIRVPVEEIAGRAYGVIDLLFVGAAARGPLAEFRGSVSGAFVRAAGCPVVVTPRCEPAPARARDAAAAGNA